MKTTLAQINEKKPRKKSSGVGARLGEANCRAKAGADISKLAKTVGEGDMANEDPEYGD